MKTTQEIVQALRFNIGGMEMILAACDRLTELERKAKDYEIALRHIENGCLVPPDGGSPDIYDYMQTAREALSKHATTTEDPRD